jgi:hypothetical protein
MNCVTRDVLNVFRWSFIRANTVLIVVAVCLNGMFQLGRV